MSEKKQNVKGSVITTKKVTTIDAGTGEILSEIDEVTSSLKEIEPPFIKMYIDDIGRLNNLSPSAVAVLGSIVRNMGYKNFMILVQPVKYAIAKDTGLSHPAIKNSIVQLVKCGLLIRKSRAFYIVDPHLFARGAWSEIKKLRLVIEYLPDGTKTVNGNMAKQLNLFGSESE